MRSAVGITLCCVGILAVPVIGDEPEKSFIGHLNNIKEVASTVPAVHKDVNPLWSRHSPAHYGQPGRGGHPGE